MTNYDEAIELADALVELRVAKQNLLHTARASKKLADRKARESMHLGEQADDYLLALSRVHALVGYIPDNVI